MKMIPVFSPEQDIKRERFRPYTHYPEDEAQEMVMAGWADWHDVKGHVIQARSRRREWDKHGTSCGPKGFIIEAAAQGKAWAVAICDGWAFAAPVIAKPAEWLDSAPTWM